MPKGLHRFAVEIGGTFTDIIYIEERDGASDLQVLKVPSTPKAPELGVFNGIERLQLDWTSVNEVLHGSTVGTNAVLERKGVPTAMLVTEGFRDILEIQRGDKENIYDIFYQRPRALVPPNMVFPVRERTLHDGSVLTPLDEQQVREAALRMKSEGIQAVGICFLHSYANPLNEDQAKEIVMAVLPDAIVLTSSELLPQFREYERASTTVMSAYIAPIMARYVDKIRCELEGRKFRGTILITQSNGGMLPAQAVQREVVRTLLSGPAAGVTGAIRVAKEAGVENLISLDMGGTSTDVCLVNNGQPYVTTENKLGGLPIAVPMIDIASVGAGGGSIAWIDDGRMLRVGPRSAGADPGPACYGRGGEEPTVTDADVWRGVLRPQKFAGGGYPLDREASGAALAKLASEVNMTVDEAAASIVKIVEANMMQAIRVVSTQRGHDPREYSLVAYGGAGPVHAVGLAEELGMNKLLVPRHAGILSAFGLLVADITRDYVQTHVSLATEMTEEAFNACFGQLRARATEEFEGYGFSRNELVFNLSCDARYQGQAFELNIAFGAKAPKPEELPALFHRKHQQRYGFSSPSQEVEIVNYRLQTLVEAGRTNISLFDKLSADVKVEESPVLLGGKWETCRFVDRATMPVGYEAAGPLVIEEETSTCYVPPHWGVKVLANGSLLIEREGQR